MNGAVGYNCERVEELGNVISEVAVKVGDVIRGSLEESVINRMGDIWFAPDAVDFFEKFAEQVKKSERNIDEAFENFAKNVENAGRAWAEQTGGKRPNLRRIDNVNLKLNTSPIKKDVNGIVAIIEDKANEVANSLSSLENAMKSEIRHYASKMEAESAFIGGNQAASVQDCFIKVSEEIVKIFSYLANGDGSLQSQIKQAATNYGTLSTTISSGFNGQ